MPIAEARRNAEVISLASSQVLRWIDELNGITDADSAAMAIKAEIRQLKHEPDGQKNRKMVRQLYAKLDSVQFKPDYVCVIIDREKDYYRAVRGFSINGISYRRLLGTNGGIKNSTIVFVSERHADELQRRIDNGRDLTQELVPAKLEAYKSLVCSASTPVSMPHGILVVKDCITRFTANTVYLNDECDGEPQMTDRPDTEIELNASDGFGLMLPSLAERWSHELGLDYVASGMNTRFSFEKGMVFTFDFVDFAENVAENSTVTDVWGDEHDIHDVELILTESMLKLYDSYGSLQDYLDNCAENGYSICVTKTCPASLENERTMNYQFIQSYDLSNDDIDELIAPTMQEIHDVLGGDWAKAVLFLRGIGLNENNVSDMEAGIIKAIMVDQRVLNDQYVRSSIYQLIQNRINEAKVGSVKVHGNYSIVSGDPYALCQSIFGLEVTGLLKAGEIYNRYWVDHGAERLACFRAPMTCHNNIRLVRTNYSDEARYWFRYMTTCTVLNAWDTMTAALNGCDFDGDMVMLTDNSVLVGRLKELPAIMCIQRKAKKKLVTEDDAIRSNIESFGNDIGKTTNWITSMYAMRARFEPGDEEYQILDYRIRCGQLYQQNAIDKAKGIICKPMPRTWHDRHSANKIEDDGVKKLYRGIVADKKPYFMRYIYPDLMKQYNLYIKRTDKNALREFGQTVSELGEIPHNELTDRQKDFLHYFDYRLPVEDAHCVMNIICKRFEDSFDGFVGRSGRAESFDYSILKSGSEYSKAQYAAVKRLYGEYIKKLQSYAIFAKAERVSGDDATYAINGMREEYRRECERVCQNERMLCDILLDICYQKGSTKKFVWDMFPEVIVGNMLEKSGGRISYPRMDDDGQIEYCGNRFVVDELILEVSR